MGEARVLFGSWRGLSPPNPEAGWFHLGAVCLSSSKRPGPGQGKRTVMGGHEAAVPSLSAPGWKTHPSVLEILWSYTGQEAHVQHT